MNALTSSSYSRVVWVLPGGFVRCILISKYVMYNKEFEIRQDFFYENGLSLDDSS